MLQNTITFRTTVFVESEIFKIPYYLFWLIENIYFTKTKKYF